MSAEPQHTCSICGNEFSGAMEFCPVCMLRKALGGGVESGESSFEELLEPSPEQAGQRFEHYERHRRKPKTGWLVVGDGVTYKSG